MDKEIEFKNIIELKTVITILDTGEKIDVISTKIYNDKDYWNSYVETCKGMFSEDDLFYRHFALLLANRDKIKYTRPLNYQEGGKIKIEKSIIKLSDTEVILTNILEEDNFCLNDKLKDFNEMVKVIELEISLRDV